MALIIKKNIFLIKMLKNVFLKSNILDNKETQITSDFFF